MVAIIGPPPSTFCVTCIIMAVYTHISEDGHIMIRTNRLHLHYIPPPIQPPWLDDLTTNSLSAVVPVPPENSTLQMKRVYSMHALFFTDQVCELQLALGSNIPATKDKKYECLILTGLMQYISTAE